MIGMAHTADILMQLLESVLCGKDQACLAFMRMIE